MPLKGMMLREIQGADGVNKVEFQSKFLLDRRKSYFMPVWDAVMVLALLLAATVTPFEVTYLQSGPCVTTLFIVNRIVDGLFVMDILFTFNLIETDPMSGRLLVTRAKIARRYIRTWFMIDFVSVLPFWVMNWVLAPADFDCQTVLSAVVELGDAEASGAVVALRMIRLVRMIKLARILKAARVVKRFENLLLTELEFPRSTLKLLKLLIVLLVVTHWQACIWSALPLYIATPPEQGEERTWVGAFIASERDNYGVDVTHIDLYIAALYWSFMTLTSIGYGDFYPRNTLERAFSCAYQLLSGMMWAYVIGTMASIASSMDPATTAYEATMEHLNRFMSEKHLSRDLRDKLRNFFEEARQVHRGADDEQLLDEMSPMLRGLVAMSTHGRWLIRVPFLRVLSDRSEGDQMFLATLTTRMQLTAYVQAERMPLGRMYILRKGLACRRWRFLAPGRAWGDDILLEDEELIDHAQAVALTFVETFHLTNEAFAEVADIFPEPYARVEDHIRLHLALQRRVIYVFAQQRGRLPKSFTPKSAAFGFAHASKRANTLVSRPSSPPALLPPSEACAIRALAVCVSRPLARTGMHSFLMAAQDRAMSAGPASVSPVRCGELLCQRDSYARTLDTVVISCKSKAPMAAPAAAKGKKKSGGAASPAAELWDVVLGDSVLFPEGGGQPSDSGTVGGIACLRVENMDGVAMHVLTAPLEAGSTVTVAIDWARREDHMAQHSSQHLLTAIALSTWGVETTSWGLGEQTSFLELGVPEITPQALAELEISANEAIKAAKAVTPSWHSVSDVNEGLVRGLRKSSKALPPSVTGPVRVIEFEGIDTNTCCGTHVKDTARLQAIKLLRVEKAKVCPSRVEGSPN